ncbi:PhzF family phenazine biosynthesis protein [Aliikangiella coralliicola]|uniref:PhzF family phenazine biosynthesis protein n=1 Tax=Aliikangiella coralliicola TaxID=2592383 RepID=A0A545TV93_9GAMM|nr:PhzF family phenazine biosynthesis isomerase [Aliikangiella coralliicola]TQV81081.1 PhzF family phenazine biosynthesis protein [Aliikangiella coralliicola]
MKSSSLKRLTAFTNNPEGGNPAGVWVGESLPDQDEMQRIAAEVGFSETAFVAPSSGKNRTVRYYSPEAEVPFCGHATIATGVAIGQESGDGTYLFETKVGDIPVTVATSDGITSASLTSVEPRYMHAPQSLVKDAMAALGWEENELDPLIPPARAFGGVWHLVLAVKSKKRLDDLQYDFEKLKTIMLQDELTTLQLVWRENTRLFHSRNPFPVGGVVEDSATGAAAAALGGYLREANLIEAPAEINILQGEVMGRPSQLKVTIPAGGGITVAGSAVQLPE